MRIALVAEENGPTRRAVPDPEGTMPGRGAYLCRGAAPSQPLARCAALAARRNAIARALRSPVIVDPKLVESIST
jgi:predicted RNA-binding protein YlxR (DUF448 family)